jgi:hypothetical protein
MRCDGQRLYGFWNADDDVLIVPAQNHLERQNSSKKMEVIDHISSRVTLAGSLGAIGGVVNAMHKGHRIPRTAGLTAFSCALSATVCVGTERLFALAPPVKEFPLVTHALSGLFGGALLGGLYLGRPLRGAFFFVPVMLLVGTGEQYLQDLRRERLEQQHREDQQQQQL